MFQQDLGTDWTNARDKLVLTGVQAGDAVDADQAEQSRHQVVQFMEGNIAAVGLDRAQLAQQGGGGPGDVTDGLEKTAARGMLRRMRTRPGLNCGSMIESASPTLARMSIAATAVLVSQTVVVRPPLVRSATLSPMPFTVRATGARTVMRTVKRSPRLNETEGAPGSSAAGRTRASAPRA